jgi:hypothetical protein
VNGRVERLRDRLDELEAATSLVTAERPEVLTPFTKELTTAR